MISVSPNIFTDSQAFNGNQICVSAYDEAMFHINANKPFDRNVACAALYDVLICKTANRDARLGALLVGSASVATPAIIGGFIDAIGSYEGKDLRRKKQIKSWIPAGEQLVGCAGSGKKGLKTINITTPSMIIAASAGAYTLKTGSRSTSSLTGSTDILESVGFKTPESDTASASILRDTGFGFYSIESMIPAFDEIYGGKFFAPHILSYVLPAMLIPVKVDSLFYGYSGPNVLQSATALVELGYKNVLACNSTSDGVHYIDEISTIGVTTIAGARNGKMGNSRSINMKEFFNVTDQASPSIVAQSTKEEQTNIFLNVLQGKLPDSEAENSICANAATILYLAKKVSDPTKGFAIAKNNIRNGSAYHKLQHIIKASHEYS